MTKLNNSFAKTKQISRMKSKCCSWVRVSKKLNYYVGTGESGKSTILKQMKLIHSSGYTKEERISFREIIFSNTVQSMRVILEAMDTMGVPVATENQKHKTVIMELPAQIDGEKLPPSAGEAIKTLWADQGVQIAFGRSREYQLNDSAK